MGEELIAAIIVPLTVGAVIILRGPLGKALAERIAGRRGDAGDGEVRQLRGEVDVDRALPADRE